MTKKNPVHWRENESQSDWYFLTSEALSNDIRFGNFDKMLVIQTPKGKLDFPSNRARVILDDPQGLLASGKAAYVHAQERLNTSAGTGNVNVEITRRECQMGCICVKKYTEWGARNLETFFG